MPTDMSERGFEDHIVNKLTVEQGYILGTSSDYEPSMCLDLAQLMAFLQQTQPQACARLGITQPGASRDQFLVRLNTELQRRGVIDVLLRGFGHLSEQFELFYGAPSAHNVLAKQRFEANRLSVTRQVRYSAEHNHSLDLVIFINGLALLSFELKNRITGQSVHDAVRQYQQTRSPREPLFAPGRCAAHFAVDDHLAKFCTELKAERSWFLPFNRGFEDGAGNPPAPHGFATDYLWNEVFTRASLFDIIEHYARQIEERDPHTSKRTTKYIWPRYHQLQAVRALLHDAQAKGAGQQYLIQHSAGSGKSYSITWLAQQLINLRRGDEPLFHTVFIITDRRVLDGQLRAELRRFTQVQSILGAVTEGSAQLREFIEQGKRIITSTIQKFHYILDELGSGHRDKRFALIIDEAHSSQGGSSTAAINQALGAAPSRAQDDDDADDDDALDYQDKLISIIEARKMISNASYFAFTATPKHKTEELFGTKHPDGSYSPFHSYTMKQAIEEGFILDVLQHYTTIQSYYQLVKTTEQDPEFETRKAQQRLRQLVEEHEQSIRSKARIMLDHFYDRVYTKRLVNGQARAMIVARSVKRAILYKQLIDELITQAQYPFKSIVAFSGERTFRGQKVTEASINGFPSAEIPTKLRADPYRLLIVADKFQTGFDEPLLQTMYVDKTLTHVKAVQTLSRLNRAHPHKREVYVLDFANDADTIRRSFEPYYRTTILSHGADPNKLHDLKAELDWLGVYTQAQVEQVVELLLQDRPRAELEAILYSCALTYQRELDEQDQVKFKGQAKSFTRAYQFLAALLEFNNPRWEELNIFLTLLIPKLPTPKSQDDSGQLDQLVDLASYRNAILAAQRIELDDEDGWLDPAPPPSMGGPQQLELDHLSQIIAQFNALFGDKLNDHDFITTLVTERLPEQLAQSTSLQHAKRQGDPHKIKVELEQAAQEALTLQLDTTSGHLDDLGLLLKGFLDDEQIRRAFLMVVEQSMSAREQLRAQPQYQAAYMAHPGWDEILAVLEDPWRPLAQGLAAQGIPAPYDVEVDLPQTSHHSVMSWHLSPHQQLVLIDIDPATLSAYPNLITLRVAPDDAPALIAQQLRPQLQTLTT